MIIGHHVSHVTVITRHKHSKCNANEVKTECRILIVILLTPRLNEEIMWSMASKKKVGPIKFIIILDDSVPQALTQGVSLLGAPSFFCYLSEDTDRMKLQNVCVTVPSDAAWGLLTFTISCAICRVLLMSSM